MKETCQHLADQARRSLRPNFTERVLTEVARRGVTPSESPLRIWGAAAFLAMGLMIVSVFVFPAHRSPAEELPESWMKLVETSSQIRRHP